MKCNNCQSEAPQGMQFCGNCGTKIETMKMLTQNQEVIKFHSMEELTSFLNNKAQTYKGALAKVLTSQLEVLKSVQSPELSSLTFDLLLDNLHMAIQESESKTQEVEIQQKFSLMINAYVFFSQAKIEAAIAANKREADALLATGANIMAKSVTAVVQYAITQTADTDAIVEIANDVFGSSSGKTSFIERIVTWWRKDVRIKESGEAFISTIDILIDKLNDDRDLIGSSRIIHGFVKQYTPKVIEVKMSPLYNKQNAIEGCYYSFVDNINEAHKKLLSALWWILGVNGIIYLILFVIWLFTFWISYLTDWSAGDWIKSFNYIAGGSIALYGVIAIVMLTINSLRKSIKKRKTKLLLKVIGQEINTREMELKSYYNNILQYFKN